MTIPRDDLAALLNLLDLLGKEHPEFEGVERLRGQVMRLTRLEGVRQQDRVRAEELAGLRHVPLGNALFTRASFEAEYGAPHMVGRPHEVDLGDAHPEQRCIFCEGEAFTVETYATDQPRIRLAFWWCQGCGLGRAVAWGHLEESTG